MKISLIANNMPWEHKQLEDYATSNNIGFEVRDILSSNEINSFVDSLGDIVIYRTSSLSGPSKHTLLNRINAKKILINQGNAQFPYIVYKEFQQRIIETKTKVKGMPTFLFSDINEIFETIKTGVLKYPFIMKPNQGKMGIGVILINNSTELIEKTKEIELPKQVFQNFVRNDGDYRVFMVGGKAIGAMKRVGADNSHLNNISQGGHGEVVDRETFTKISEIAMSIASTFKLQLCGVDVIENLDTGEFLFMEVNTAAQWQGFQSTTEINVAECIFDYCRVLYEKSQISSIQSMAKFVKTNFDNNLKYLPGNSFHYLSRMFLWTKEEKYKLLLDEQKASYIGDTADETKEKVSKIFQRTKSDKPKVLKNAKKIAREEFYLKYPERDKYLRFLYKYLFSKNIYGYDISNIASDLFSEEDLVQLYRKLYADKDAIAVLSTHAINFFYLTKIYLGEKFHSYNLELNPEIFLDIFKNSEKYNNEDLFGLKIYLITHCVIAESQFYYKKVTADIYKTMLAELSDFLIKNYFRTSLDNKFEYLVCCRLCDYKNELLENIIYQEAMHSTESHDVYISDIFNASGENKYKTMSSAEHRNVLFIMSRSDYQD